MAGNLAVTNRRCLFRALILLIGLLMMMIWFRSFLDLFNGPRTNERTKAIGLPVVYMDADVKEVTLSTDRDRPKIPRIIHQTWRSYDIPAVFVPLVRTWYQKQPDWEYWFWTDDDAARFIRLFYPAYYDMYKSYPQNIHRADAMRYFILYHFGGWYSDMDIELRRPLEEFTVTHQCIISQEPWAHTKMFWGKDRLACNALMAARPRHPFFDLVIKELPFSNTKTSAGEVMDKTGPKLIDRMVTAYEKRYSNTYAMNDTLYLADPDAFLPTVASNALALIKQLCAKRQNDAQKQAICNYFIENKFANNVPNSSYTNHVWVHTYYGINEKVSENIFTLIPKAKKITDMLNEMEKSVKV